MFTILVTDLVDNSIFTLFPIPVAKTFGMKYGIQVYTLVMLSWACTAFTNVLFVKLFSQKLENQGGNIYVYAICLVWTIVAIFLNSIFKEDLDIENLEKKGKIILAD
jgi:hypothetical protein